MFLQEGGVPLENDRDSFSMDRGRMANKTQGLFPRHISNWLALLYSG